MTPSTIASTISTGWLFNDDPIHQPTRRPQHARPDLVWVELGKNVVELASAIRVRYELRTSDALQAASCLQLGVAHLFLTGDITFKKVAELNTKMLT